MNTVDMPVSRNAHQTQFPATPWRRTISVTRFGVSALNVVATPEEMPVEETIDLVARARDELEVGLGAVIVNRVLPDDVTGTFYAARRRQERVYLDEIERRFSQFPQLQVPQLESDVCGLASLERVSALLVDQA